MTDALRSGEGSAARRVPDAGVGGLGLLAVYAAAQTAGLVLSGIVVALDVGASPAALRLLLVRLSYWLSSPLFLVAAVAGIWLGRGRAGAGRRLARWPGLLALLIGALAGLVLKLGADVIAVAEQWLAGPIVGNNPMTLYPQAFHGLAAQLVLVAVVCLVAPAAEELFFRGMLFGWLRRRLPRWLAVSLAGVLFGLAHVDPASGSALMASLPLVLPLGFVGAGLCLLYERYGSLWVPAAAHAAVNFSAMALVLRV